MTLSACLSKVEDPRKWDVRFYEMEYDPTLGQGIHTTSANLNALYHDWIGDCENCPENGEFIYGLMFACEEDGRVFLVDNTPEGSRDLTFEGLMQSIQNIFYT